MSLLDTFAHLDWAQVLQLTWQHIMLVGIAVGLAILVGVPLGILMTRFPAVAGPLQAMTDGRLDSPILRQLLIALAMIVIMLLRPRGLWPTPEHGKAAPAADREGAR